MGWTSQACLKIVHGLVDMQVRCHGFKARSKRLASLHTVAIVCLLDRPRVKPDEGKDPRDESQPNEVGTPTRASPRQVGSPMTAIEAGVRSASGATHGRDDATLRARPRHRGGTNLSTEAA